MAAVLDPIGVLKSLKDAGSATATQIGTSHAYLNELAEAGLVLEAGVHKTGRRGRPAVQFKLSKKGSDKVRRAVDHR